MVTAAVPTRDVISFGPFSLVASERLLVKEGTPVELGARAFDILIALISRPNEVVGKKDLMGFVWPDLTVEEGSLRFHMTSLRKALGDGEAGARYITTVAGRGYCFVAPVSHASSPKSSAKTDGLISDQVVRLPTRLQRMVGRAESIRQISGDLATHRFVTIVGPGGIGKTTVAVAIGHSLLADFGGAVRFFDLGPLSDPLLVPSAIASTLGLMVQSSNPIPSLITFLRDKRMLLVLDSCEHVIQTAAALTESIMYEAPEIRILATSREPLRAEGEYVHRLLPLESPPDSESLKAADALTFSAVQLFVERITASGSRFELTDADAPIAADICRKLDGMALAIELAAGRVSAYGVRGTAELLDNRFKLLWQGRRAAPPRHQTLSATLDWSHNLLSELERVVLRRLAVFVGVFTLEAARAVVAGEDVTGLEAVEAMGGLVSKSLIAADTSTGNTRYRLLDTTRAYLLEKLVESGETDTIARRHAIHFCEFLQRTNVNASEAAGAKGFARYGIHVGNVRAALEWSFSQNGDIAIGTALAAAAARLFLEMSLLTECHAWCERALTALDHTARGTRLEMELQAALGQSLMFTKGNSEDARQAFLKGLEISEKLGDAAYRLQHLGALHLFHERIGNFPESLVFAERSEKVARERGDPTSVAAAHSWLAISHHLIGDQAAAHKHLEIALAAPMMSRRADTVQFGFDYQNRARITLARNLWLRGYPDKAAAIARKTVEEAATLEHPITLCMALIWAVAVFTWRREWDSVEENIDRFITHAERYSLAPYIPVGAGVKGQLSICRGELQAGILAVRGCLGALHAGRYELLTTEFINALAQGLAMTGQFDDAVKTIDEAIAQAERNGELFVMPELLRVKADILTAMPEPNMQVAEECLLRSLDQSRSQSALSWELRSATSLARLWSTGRRANEGWDILASTHGKFTEGFDTVDLSTAKQLLDQRPSVTSR